MTTFKNNLMASGAVFGLLISLGTVASAQSDDTKKVTKRDEIIVTARKRAENIQEVPLAISAFTEKMIEDSGIRDMSDIAKQTSGFSLDDEFGRVNSNRPVIRGQATILGASGVSTFVDGILIGGSLLDYDINDVERVEVIKGPQSALYGRNTYSGAINIITKSPSEEHEANFKVDAGSHGRFEISGAMRGPISDVLSANVSARHSQRGGVFTNIYDNTEVGQQNSTSLSATLFYEPQDNFSARARVRFSKLDDDQPRLFVTDPAMNNVFQDFGGTYNGRYRYFDGEILAEDINIDDVRMVGEKGHDESNDIQASLSIKYDFDENMSVEFINGLNRNNSEGKGDLGYTEDSLTPFSVYIGPVFPVFAQYYFHAFVTSGINDFATDYKTDSTDYSSELRFNYETDQWDAVFGGFYYKSDSDYEGRRTAPPGFANTIEQGYNTHIARMTALCADHASDAVAPCYASPHFNSILNFGDDLQDLELFADRSLSNSERENLAAFASVNYDITDQFAVSAEGRYTSEKVTTNSISRSAVYDYLGNLDRMEVAPQVVRTATFNSFNPRVTAKFNLNDETNLYAVAARGNKPGGFNNDRVTAQGLGTYDEETVWSFEGGAKNSFLDGDLIFNVSAFHNMIKGYQLTQSVVVQGTNTTTTVIDNVGRVRIMGLELDASYQVPSVSGLTLTGNYAYTDSNIREGTDIGEGRHLDTLDDGRVNCSIGFAVNNGDCASGDNVLPGSIVGRQLPRQPTHMANIGFNLTKPFNDRLDYFINSNLSYESKKYSQVHNLAYVGSATLLNGSIGLENDLFRFTIWGRNLTGEDSVVQAIRFIDEAWSFQRAFGGTPRIGREYGASLAVNF